MFNNAQSFLTTAHDSMVSLRDKFDIDIEVEHRQLLILCTDCVELSLKALLYLYGWPKDAIIKKINHRLSEIFKHIDAPKEIIDATAKFDNKEWSWLRRYPETCYSAQTTEVFSGNPLPITEKIVDWVTSEYNSYLERNPED